MLDFYKMLGVAINANTEEMKAAHARRVAELTSIYQDSFPAVLPMVLCKLEEALATLSDPDKQPTYDQQLAHASTADDCLEMFETPLEFYNTDYVSEFIGMNGKVAIMFFESVNPFSYQILAEELSKRMLGFKLYWDYVTNVSRVGVKHLEKILVHPDANDDLRYKIIKALEIGPSGEAKFSTQQMAELEQFKLMPSGEIDISQALQIAAQQLSAKDFISYVNSSIWMVRKIWNNRQNYSSIEINDWVKIIISHPDYFKTVLPEGIEKWPAEAKVMIAKTHPHLKAAIFNQPKDFEELNGKLIYELYKLDINFDQQPIDLSAYSNIIPCTSADLHAALAYYKLIHEAATLTVSDFEECVVIADLSKENIIDYLSENQTLAIKVKLGGRRWICGHSLTLNNRDWAKVLYKNKKSIFWVNEGLLPVINNPNVFALAKHFFHMAWYFAKNGELKWLSEKQLLEIADCYKDDMLSEIIDSLIENRPQSSASVCSELERVAEYFDSFVYILKKIYHNRADDISRFLNNKNNRPIALLIWSEPKYRVILTQWDWTFLAMNNPMLALRIRASDCKDWHRFNLNCLARLYEDCCLEILSEPALSSRLTRADLLELFKMHMSQGIHRIIINNLDMLDKIFASADCSDELQLAEYLLKENCPVQALAILKNAVEKNPQEKNVYYSLLRLKDVSVADLITFLNGINTVIKECQLEPLRSEYIAIRESLKLQLFTLTGDEVYSKTDAQCELDEQEAILIEKDKLQAREEKYIRNICHALYCAAEGIDKDKAQEVNLFSLKELRKGKQMMILDSTEASAFGCYDLTYCLIAFIRDKNTLKVSVEAIKIYVGNAALREYLQKEYPDFNQQMQLRYPTYAGGSTLFSHSTRVVLEPTIKNITASASQGNNYILNMDL